MLSHSLFGAVILGDPDCSRWIVLLESAISSHSDPNAATVLSYNSRR